MFWIEIWQNRPKSYWIDTQVYCYFWRESYVKNETLSPLICIFNDFSQDLNLQAYVKSNFLIIFSRTNPFFIFGTLNVIGNSLIFRTLTYFTGNYLKKKKFFHFVIIVMTADENQIHKNTSNTSSLTWRGYVTIF